MLGEFEVLGEQLANVNLLGLKILDLAVNAPGKSVRLESRKRNGQDPPTQICYSKSSAGDDENSG